MNTTDFFNLSFPNKLAAMCIVSGIAMLLLFGVYLAVHLVTTAYYTAKYTVQRKFGLLKGTKET